MRHFCEVCEKNISEVGRLKTYYQNERPVKVYACKSCFEVLIRHKKMLRVL